MGFNGSIGVHIKTGRRHMAEDHFRTLLDPPKGYERSHEDPGPIGPDPRSQVPGPGPRSRVLGPGPRSKVSGPIGPAPKGPGPDPKSWSSVQLLYIGPGPRCGSQLQGAGPGYIGPSRHLSKNIDFSIDRNSTVTASIKEYIFLKKKN